MKVKWKTLLISLIAVYLVAFIGTVLTAPNIKSVWYNSTKPSITPPAWIFPIVWNVLFFLIALSLYFSWIKGKEKKRIIYVFGVNFALNILWSLFYFQLKSPLIAFYDLILLWVSIITMLSLGWKIDKKAFYLLVPYFVWVSFAGLLNFLVI